MKKYLIIFLLSGCVAGNRSADQSLTGEWKLTESLIDIGDGKGTWQKQTSGTTVSFFADGKLWSDDPFFSKATVYQVKKDSLFLRSADTAYQLYFQPVSADTFIVRPGCIEACGYKYARLKN